jgi:EmrB/QacA subfamily drug resistance transporter
MTAPHAAEGVQGANGAEGAESVTPMRTFWITAAATFIGFLDITIVNVAIPDMAASFEDAGISSLSWVINGYAIVFAALLVPLGRLGDLRGRKAIFLAGVATFTVASLVAAIAPSIEVLLAARVVQGGAAAAMLPMSLALLLHDFPPARWATAVAMWGIVGALASALGPLLGGVLIDLIDWRVIFAINVPVGIATVLAGRAMLRESRAQGETRAPDVIGAALLAGAIGLVALGLVKSNDWGWGSVEVIASFAGAVVLAAALGYRLTSHPAPIFDLAMWRNRDFAVANASTFTFGVAFYALLLCAVLFLTQVWEYSILEAGLAIAPGPLMSAVVSTPGGRLVERYGHRAVIVVGALIYAAAMLWLALAIDENANFLGVWLPGYALAGVGVGLVYPSQASAAAMSVPPIHFGAGIGLNITARQLGAALGVALLVAILGTSALGAAPGRALDDFQAGFALCAIGALLVAVVTVPLRTLRPPTAAATPDAPAAPLTEEPAVEEPAVEEPAAETSAAGPSRG